MAAAAAGGSAGALIGMMGRLHACSFASISFECPCCVLESKQGRLLLLLNAFSGAAPQPHSSIHVGCCKQVCLSLRACLRASPL